MKRAVERRIHMATKSVRIDEDLYERIRAHKREGETFSETIERLIGGWTLLDFAGGLSEDEAAAMADRIDEASDEYAESVAEDFEL